MTNPQNSRQNKPAAECADRQLAIPLLEMDFEDDFTAPSNQQRERVPKDLAIYSMLIGICIGSLLHLATLGGSFVVLSCMGVETSSTPTRFLAFGLSFAITLFAVTLSSAVRFLLVVALKASTAVTPSEDDLAYVRMCNLLGLVTGIFLASVSMESLINWNGGQFFLHTVALLVWVATTLVATERSYVNANLMEQSLDEKDGIAEISGRVHADLSV